MALYLDPTYPIPVGKIPAAGTQVVGSALAAGTTVDVYPGNASKTFYLSSASLYAWNGHSVADWVYLTVTNADNAVQYYLERWLMVPGGYLSMTPSFLPPLEIPATWKVRVDSLHGSLAAFAFVHGYEMGV